MDSLRAFVYDRTSRIVEGVGTSNLDQAAENDAFCRRQGWVIAERFTDPGKGASRHSRSRRTDFERMVEGIERRECDVLVVWEASRAYRDLKVYVQLRDLCVQNRVLLCYNGQVYDMTRGNDRFITGLNALQAELEAENIRDRILRTTRANAERGRPHGRLPYGYRRVYDERTGALIEQIPDEGQASIVREVAKRIAGGESIRSIAHDLDARGIPAPQGGTWEPGYLPRMVTKATNIGKRLHRGTVVGPALWEPILDEETYYACVSLLSEPGRAQVTDRAVKYLLVGIARCGLCGAGLRTLPTQNHAARSYMCNKCFKVWLRTDLFDRIVIEAVLQRIETPAFAQSLRDGADTDGTRAALAEAEALEAELGSARELAGKWENGRVLLSAVSLARMEQELLPRIEDARRRAVSVSVPHALREVAGPGAREKWERQEDLTWRRTLVKAVVVPRLFPAGKGVRTIRPGRYSLEWLY